MSDQAGDNCTAVNGRCLGMEVLLCRPMALATDPFLLWELVARLCPPVHVEVTGKNERVKGGPVLQKPGGPVACGFVAARPGQG